MAADNDSTALRQMPSPTEGKAQRFTKERRHPKNVLFVEPPGEAIVLSKRYAAKTTPHEAIRTTKRVCQALIYGPSVLVERTAASTNPPFPPFPICFSCLVGRFASSRG